MRLPPASLLALVFAFSPLLRGHCTEKSVAYIGCTPEEHPAFAMKVDYEVQGLGKGTRTLHFKKVLVEPGTDCEGGGCGSVSRGGEGPLYTSFTEAVKCDGIHLDFKLERTGKHPTRYEKSLVVPWSALDHTTRDEDGTIHVTTTWFPAPPATR